jgi:hypothetical protein
MINTIEKKKRMSGIEVKKREREREINYFVDTCLISTGNAFK